GGQTGVDVPAGQARSVRIAVPSRTLRVWDATAHAWARPATTYDVLIAHDLDDVRIMQQWTDAEAATPRSHK
ncbi:MAG: fibronectin type III-like domain-contianing protein, partial [Propionibacteriaceae bacterium]|nr:fibronectin type III-like domain-contianing protein [Propionibacteriaceae bacterium]